MQRIAEEQETLPSEKWLSTRKKNMLAVHERRKSVSSASVMWYIVSVRQFRTDRPSRAVTRFVAIPGMETRGASLGFSPRYLVPSTRA
jgi:hypothetical protein